ncbi:hypothetical protein [Flagellimonas pelagia]|uniref:hypothetical protein n=1 Tax=Flagellimonas pelagia TaxID=2306998 RepID=UPI0016055214|nr:hypothetical protein [Allomuricauda maritima]
MKRIGKNSLLAFSLGMVYLWFGALKFFPDLSPAESLAKSTMHVLTFGLVPDTISIVLLAIWETWVGVFLILNLYRRTAAFLALVHILFTFTPLVFFPDEVFNEGPLVLTLLGQYIIKNLVIVAALLSILDVDVRVWFRTVLWKRRIPKSSNIPSFGFIEEKQIKNN